MLITALKNKKKKKTGWVWWCTSEQWQKWILSSKSFSAVQQAQDQPGLEKKKKKTCLKNSHSNRKVSYSTSPKEKIKKKKYVKYTEQKVLYVRVYIKIGR